LEWLKGSLVSKAYATLGFDGGERQRRVHLEVEPTTFAAKEGQLFTTEGLEIGFKQNADQWPPQPAAICSRIESIGNEWPDLEPLAPLGGERRLGYWSEPKIDWPAAPSELASVRRFRLQLITPAAFDLGWKPGWLARGGPPGLPDSKLKLVAAAVPRAVPHSGWDLTKRGSRGQKATRFLAPAGSVYFFESETEVDIRRLWLRSISDRPQDRLDGFGIVLCGEWKWLSE
jgi:CRISPR-associated protein Cmr3